jgi:hypothetical protein
LVLGIKGGTRLRVFEIRVLRILFRPKRYEVVGHMERFCECGTFGTFRFHKMPGKYRVTAGLMASRVVVSSRKLVS